MCTHLIPSLVPRPSASESEIVVPIFSREGELVAILDIDCPLLCGFDDQDKAGLEIITAALGQGSDWGPLALSSSNIDFKIKF